MSLGQKAVCPKNSLDALLPPVYHCPSEHVLTPVSCHSIYANVQCSCVLFVIGSGGKPSLFCCAYL